MPMTIGWKPRKWKGSKVSCERCGKGVRRGVCHVNDKSDPPARCLCVTCYQGIMSPDGAQAPKGTPGFE
jgi:hypothetical protein